jgi:hypothetical protein
LSVAQKCKQPPQFKELLVVSTQLPLHSVSGAAQLVVVVTVAHAPAEQTWSDAQALPQAPQLLASTAVSMQTSVQLVSLPGQPQLPLIQASSAEQLLPQLPQLWMSLVTEMQTPSQYCWPLGQVTPALLGQPVARRQHSAARAARTSHFIILGTPIGAEDVAAYLTYFQSRDIGSRDWSPARRREFASTVAPERYAWTIDPYISSHRASPKAFAGNPNATEKLDGHA